MVTPINPVEERLRRLVERGYFPIELPPTFVTAEYAKHAWRFASTWDPTKIRRYWTAPEHFSIPRYGQMRRKLSIVNPVNQLHVAHLVSSNWKAIRHRLRRSKTTEFSPKIVAGDGRAVTGVDFDGVSRRRAEILSKYGRYVKTDIARFYPSVYTHSIPWAVLGKAQSKATMRTPSFTSSFANHLDKAISAGQAGQTIGIPIGPDTSRIVSELIATELERLVIRAIPDFEERSVRYVDDMLIGILGNESPEAVLSKLSAALYEYELELNGEKTEIHGIGSPHNPEWIHFVRSFQVSPLPRRQREDIDAFFEHAIHLADQNPRDNALLFSAKRAATFSVRAENKIHLIRWLLYLAARSSSCLSFVVEFLASEHRRGASLPTSEVEGFVKKWIPISAESAHTAEVAWLLFAAIELKIRLEASLFTRVVGLPSSVCAILTFDLIQRGLVSGKVDTSGWLSAATDTGLKSDMWLAAYEVTKKGWWGKRVSPSFIKKADFFSDIWNADVNFYDPSKGARIPAPALKPFVISFAKVGYPE